MTMLENPGIVSIPLGFLAAFLGTILSRERASEERYEELRVRALTGLGRRGGRGRHPGAARAGT
jgi:cation/acetate symporter